MRAFFLLLLLFLAPLARADDAPLRLAIVGGGVWAPHLIDPAADRPGAAIEMQRLVLREAGVAMREVVFDTVAAASAGFHAGEADALIVTLNWVDQPAPDGTRFTAAFYMTADRLYSAIGGPMTRGDCASLSTAPVWGVAGYRYPCGDVFSPPRLRDERALVQALADGVIDMAVIDEQSARWWTRRLDAPLAAGSFVGETALRFRFHNASDLLIDRLNAAIARLQVAGADRAIRERYWR